MTKDDIIRMAREAGMPYFYGTWEIANLDGLERFAALVAAHEREACAKVCETMARRTNDIRRAALEMAVENIMARGEK
jgi:hypothetical protein